MCSCFNDGSVHFFGCQGPFPYISEGGEGGKNLSIQIGYSAEGIIQLGNIQRMTQVSLNIKIR